MLETWATESHSQKSVLIWHTLPLLGQRLGLECFRLPTQHRLGSHLKFGNMQAKAQQSQRPVSGFSNGAAPGTFTAPAAQPAQMDADAIARAVATAKAAAARIAATNGAAPAPHQDQQASHHRDERNGLSMGAAGGMPPPAASNSVPGGAGTKMSAEEARRVAQEAAQRVAQQARGGSDDWAWSKG